MQTRRALFAIALFVVPLAACKEDASSTESACQKVCRRVGEAEAACAPADCVETCEMELPSCDAENRAYVACLADAQLLGCLNHSEPTALGECDGQQSALAACLTEGATSDPSGPDDDDDSMEDTGSPDDTGGSETGAEDESSDESGGGPCDPLDAACVACGDASCGTETQECCWSEAPACEAPGSCEASVVSSCDGAEDCAGAQCCVEMSISGTDGSVGSGAAACTGGGGSVCCNATPGQAGCAAEADVEACVCGYDDYCCSVEWDATCAAYVGQLGCGTCAAGCSLTNGSTGTGSFIRSLACRTSADCAGAVGEFGVPYGTCCSGTNFGVGACVSETYAYAIMEAGGSCS